MEWEQEMFKKTSVQRAENAKRLQKEERPATRGALLWFNSNLSSQIEGLKRYMLVPQRQRLPEQQTTSIFYRRVLPKKASRRRQQNRRRTIHHEGEPMSLDEFLKMRYACSIRTFDKRMYRYQPAQCHSDEQFAIDTTTGEAVPLVSLFTNIRTIYSVQNEQVIASRKNAKDIFRYRIYQC
ncbi:hypothetical protein HB834_06125 [Listeria booriae]|uniref:hypothetical protein n=1 Tax=Listeria booriae TaxID=1552123 RepID=UPI00164E6F17|nr:hypothetical protein [Listeria booriae]MBC6151031.1 hypothetical protein [Listeria booriae]MBC6151220.1 hypothetical protein [Listeria booriae]